MLREALIAMARPEKVSEVASLEERLRRSTAVIFTDFRGLTVGEITTLRTRLREAGGEYRVVKNRLFGIAARAAGVEELGACLEGPTAAAFVNEDPGVIARVLQEFARQTRKLAVKGGILSGSVLDGAGARSLADLPTRPVLIARVVYGVAAPLSGLGGVLTGLPRALVVALEEIRKQKEAA